MDTPSTEIEPLLANSLRVLRNSTALPDLIAAYPSLKQKSLTFPSTLTDSERRLLLDLPDEDMETSNIGAATRLSRIQLIEKAVSDRTSLTQEEVVLLDNRFWTPNTGEETSKIFSGLANVSQKGLHELVAARRPAYFPNEEKAFSIGLTELWKRAQAIEDEKLRVLARSSLPDAKEWIQYLYRQEEMHWGFVCLYDAAAQQLDPGRLDNFRAHLSSFFQYVLMYNGSKDIIDQKWRLMPFNSPNTGFAPTAPLISDQGGAIFRNAFQQILRDPQEYQNAEDVTAMNTPTSQFKNGIAKSGILTNTFLVIDPICIDSVLADGRWFDDMRILAFEADFPVEGRKYAEGYQGFTWVRLDQLVYNFYELRLMKADEVGVDEIWKVAQESRHKAFVSMDPEEAQSWTTSRGTSGFTRDSVLGKRWYSIRDARKETKVPKMEGEQDS